MDGGHGELGGERWRLESRGEDRAAVVEVSGSREKFARTTYG